MSIGLRRGLADHACRFLQTALPPSCKSWGLAIRCETNQIHDDTKALLFALDSMLGLMPHALASRLIRALSLLIGKNVVAYGGLTTMHFFDRALRRPRLLGILSVTSAVTLGLCYMAAAGAPAQYLGINIGALIVGLMMMAVLGLTVQIGQRWSTGAFMAMAGVLLATALLGDKVDGAARWVTFGGLSIQPSLILLPLMIVSFVRWRNALMTVGIIAAAIAMALQPDRAMAGMLAASLVVLLILRPDRRVFVASGVSIIGFAATVVRADTLPAAPYVDQILYSSFDVHIAIGAAVLCGSALLLVPAVVGLRRDPANREIYAAFGTAWLVGIVAAALGNYPTPIVGYGGSAIIGYALSLLALPRQAEGHHKAGSLRSIEPEGPPLERRLFVGSARFATNMNPSIGNINFVAN